MLHVYWALSLFWLGAIPLGIAIHQAPFPGWWPTGQVSGLPDLFDASITDLIEALAAGRITSVQLIETYQARIAEVNAYTHAVIDLNPKALAQAAVSDNRRKLARYGVPYRPLEGIPILIKDNIGQAGEPGINTTAGSFALLGSMPERDAFIVQKLKEAGAIILGNTNMCEWAHGRGEIPFGWSARGGQTLSPFHQLGNPCGSSSGSAVATTLGLAAASIGTETGWSITCPAHRNNIVGLKPTRGLTSRAGVVPLMLSRDSVGPLVRSVADAAIMLQAIAGRDLNDNATLEQPALPDYSKNLRLDALDGVRLGVLRTSEFTLNKSHPETGERLDWAAEVIRELGAVVVDNFGPTRENFDKWEFFMNSSDSKVVSTHEVKYDIEGYLRSLPVNPENVTSINDLIDFNLAHAEQELPANYSLQDHFYLTLPTDGVFNTTYLAARAKWDEMVRTEGLACLMDQKGVDAVIALVEDLVSITYSALGGMPVVTVPLGFFSEAIESTPIDNVTVYPAPNMPFGLMFIGRRWSEQQLIGYAYAFEQKTRIRELGRKFILPEARPKTTLTERLTVQNIMY